MVKWGLRVGSILLSSLVSGIGFQLRHGSILAPDAGAALQLVGLVLLYGGVIPMLWVWFGWDRTKVNLGRKRKDDLLR